jgi:hypothetical protein
VNIDSNDAERPQRNMAFCSAAKALAPANGQWHFLRLVYIGASGMQASEPAFAAPGK